jgi:hypothetical protein
MPTTGQILYWPSYKFTDNTVHDKLLVVMNDSSSSEDLCLLLLTTSQKWHYPNFFPGCNFKQKCFHVPLEWHECFDQPTFVILPLIIEYECKLIWEKYNYGVRLLSKSLSNDCVSQIKACLSKYIDDISPRHKSMIF